MAERFADKLQASWTTRKSLLCVGFDPDLQRIPEHLRDAPKPLFSFCKAIAEASAKYVCAWKPQFAHFAGQDRLDELKELIAYLKSEYADIPVILDAKRGDIGSTAEWYAREAFAVFGADAVTANPYMGGDTLEPLLSDPRRGVFALCRTSNPGSGDVQSLECSGRRIFEIVAEQAAREWNRNGNLGLVVGATYPEDLRSVRSLVGNMPILVPGVGAQGGDLGAVLAAGALADGTGLIINTSRSVLYAGRGKDFADAAGAAAKAVAEVTYPR